MEMPTIPQLIYVMKSSNQQSISENSKVEFWTFMINFHQAASAWLSVASLNHETVTTVVPPMSELRSQLGARKGKCGRNLTTKISKSKFFDFPKLGPARLWGLEGMVGCAETCSKQSPCASRTASSPLSRRCDTARYSTVQYG